MSGAQSLLRCTIKSALQGFMLALTLHPAKRQLPADVRQGHCGGIFLTPKC